MATNTYASYVPDYQLDGEWVVVNIAAADRARKSRRLPADDEIAVGPCDWATAFGHADRWNDLALTHGYEPTTWVVRRVA